MNRKLRRHKFSVRPVNVQSEQGFVELLGRSRNSFDGNQGQKFRRGSLKNGYPVTPDEFVLVARKYRRDNSGLTFEFRVRLRCGDKLNPITLIPDDNLDSMESLGELIDAMCVRVTRCLAPPEMMPHQRSAFCGNALQRTEARA